MLKGCQLKARVNPCLQSVSEVFTATHQPRGTNFRHLISFLELLDLLEVVKATGVTLCRVLVCAVFAIFNKVPATDNSSLSS